MDNHEVVTENAMGYLSPLQHVETVEPTHLDGIATGIAVILEVRNEDIVVEIVAIHPHEVEEDEVVVAVAMDHDGGTLGLLRVLCRGIYGVDADVVVAGNYSILQDALLVEGVVPGGTSRKEGIRFVASALDIIHSVGSRSKGVITHEGSYSAAAHHENRCQKHCGMENFSGHCLCMLITFYSVPV